MKFLFLLKNILCIFSKKRPSNYDKLQKNLLYHEFSPEFSLRGQCVLIQFLVFLHNFCYFWKFALDLICILQFCVFRLQHACFFEYINEFILIAYLTLGNSSKISVFRNFWFWVIFSFLRILTQILNLVDLFKIVLGSLKYQVSFYTILYRTRPTPISRMRDLQNDLAWLKMT